MKRGRGELGGGTCRTVSGSGALGTTVFAVLVLLLGAGTWLLAAGEHYLADAAAFDDAEREGDVAVAHAEADVLPPAALPGAAAPVPLARSEAFADADGRARVPAAEVLVLSASGQPFEGAKVEAVAAGARDERTTGPDGRATVRLPLAATVDLRATAPGHLPTGFGDHPFGTPATIELRRAARLFASVRDPEGVPLAGVRVALRGRSPVHGETGPDGRVCLDGIRPGTYDVALTRAGASASATLVAGVFLPEGDHEVGFTFPAGTTVAGVVRDAESGAPLAGAQVRLRWEARSGQVQRFHHERRARTDAAGAFAFPGVAPGRATVIADAPTHAPRSTRCDVVATRGELHVELALGRSAEVRGRVVDEAGAPIAGAEVTLCWVQDGTFRFAQSAKAGADGAFVLRDVVPRDGLLLAASLPGRAPGGAIVGRLGPGEVREGLEVVMKRGVAVRGMVRDEDGSPRAGARVRLVPKMGADRYTVEVETAADGTFRFADVVRFPYRVEAHAEGRFPATVDLQLDGDRVEFRAGELRLRAAHELSGTVVLRGTGAGAGGARVRLRPAGRRGSGPATTTDDLGRFTLAPLEAGDYLLDVHAPDVAPQPALPVRIPHHGALRIPVLPRPAPGTGIVDVEVLDPRTRAPVAGVQFGGVDARRVAFADGIYSLRGIPAGPIDLSLRAPGFQPLVLPGVVVLAGQVRKLPAVSLQPGAGLRVRVVDERGRPFPAGRVKVSVVDDRGLTARAALTPSEARPDRGEWRFDGLAWSRFTVRVTGPNTHQPAVQTVELISPETQDLRFRLARKPRARGKPGGK